MSNLIPTNTWIPPEAQKMSGLVKWGLAGAVGLGGLYAFVTVAPTAVDAIVLLNKILQSTTSMAISGGILIGTLLVLNETFSSTGKINQMLRLPYWMAMRWITRQLITIDPFGAIDQRIAQVEADEQTFDQQVEKVSGIVARLREQEAACRKKVDDAQRIGKVAHDRGAKDVEELQTTIFRQYSETAEVLAGMSEKLRPMLDTFQRIAQTCQQTASRLKIERQTLQIKWDAQSAFSGVVSSASRILGKNKTQAWNLAEQASDIVNIKFGEELGRLDHLKLVTEPLMDSFDLENATYNEDMLKVVQQVAIASIPAPAKTPILVPAN